MKRKIGYIITIALFVMCYSCKSDHKSIALPEKNDQYTGIKVGIVSRSGQKFEDADYISMPLNHGKLLNRVGDSLDFLIISLPILSDSVHIIPLAIFETEEGNSKRAFVLCYPEDDNLMIMPKVNFEVFMMKYHSIKIIIDTWFSNYKGLGKVRVQNWRDGMVAQQQINDFLSILPDKFEQ